MLREDVLEEWLDGRDAAFYCEGNDRGNEERGPDVVLSRVGREEREKIDGEVVA